MEHCATKCESLFPAKRQFTSQTRLVILQVGHLEYPLAPTSITGSRNAVESTKELDVLGNCQICIERKELRHVPDVATDVVGASHDIKASHPCCTRRRTKETVQHLDCGGLSRPVWAEEPEDLTRSDVKAHAVYRGEIAKRASEFPDRDRVNHRCILCLPRDR